VATESTPGAGMAKRYLGSAAYCGDDDRWGAAEVP
jgi:hypothetical protein